MKSVLLHFTLLLLWKLSYVFIFATQSKGPFLWDLNEEAYPSEDDSPELPQRNPIDQSSTPKNQFVNIVTKRRTLLNRRKRYNMNPSKPVSGCDIHRKGCYHWDSLSPAERKKEKIKDKRRDPAYWQRELAARKERYKIMPQTKKQNLIDDAVERRRRRVERMTDQEREQFRLKFNQDARRRYQATYKFTRLEKKCKKKSTKNFSKPTKE